MFQYDFMINAFAAAGIVAVVAGVVGFTVDGGGEGVDHEIVLEHAA